MNETLQIAVSGLTLMMVMGFATWLLSLYLRDVSIVDSLWSLMFLAAVLLYAGMGGVHAPASNLLLALVCLWALRLSLFLTVRNWGEPEDRRYREIRGNNQPNFEFKSLYLVFGLQAGLAWIISLPLLFAVTADKGIGVLEIIALGIWVVGFLFETIGDQQLYRFRSRPENHGKVLDKGLWAYTRHPNYFGECLIWWAYYLFAVAAGAWWTIFAPLLMTVLLLKVSGVSLMERDISDRRAAYREYIDNTNAFIPGMPRQRRTISRSTTS